VAIDKLHLWLQLDIRELELELRKAAHTGPMQNEYVQEHIPHDQYMYQQQFQQDQ